MINSNLELLERNTKIKAKALIDLAQQNGLDVYVFEGLRSIERQYELFGKGRTTATLRKAGVHTKYANPNAKKVTWTIQSNHLKGQAIDIVFDLDKDPKKKRPSWNGNYQLLIYLSEYVGLRNLAPLETCHFEHNSTTVEAVLENNSKLRHLSQNQNERDFLHNVNNTIRKYI